MAGEAQAAGDASGVGGWGGGRDGGALVPMHACAPRRRTHKHTHAQTHEHAWASGARSPDMTAEMRWLRSPKVGLASLRVRKQMS